MVSHLLRLLLELVCWCSSNISRFCAILLSKYVNVFLIETHFPFVNLFEQSTLLASNSAWKQARSRDQNSINKQQVDFILLAGLEARITYEFCVEFVSRLNLIYESGQQVRKIELVLCAKTNARMAEIVMSYWKAISRIRAISRTLFTDSWNWWNMRVTVCLQLTFEKIKWMIRVFARLLICQCALCTYAMRHRSSCQTWRKSTSEVTAEQS